MQFRGSPSRTYSAWRRRICSVTPWLRFCRATPAPVPAETTLRVALVHDYLNQRGGAERVFAHFLEAYPGAPVYTALYEPELADLVPPERVRTSFLQRFPARK